MIGSRLLIPLLIVAQWLTLAGACVCGPPRSDEPRATPPLASEAAPPPTASTVGDAVQQGVVPIASNIGAVTGIDYKAQLSIGVLLLISLALVLSHVTAWRRKRKDADCKRRVLEDQAKQRIT